MSSKLPTRLTPAAIKVIFSILCSLPIPTKVYELTIDSALNITEKDSITSIDLQIHLVLEKMENGEFKLVPSEVNISIDTQYDNKKTKTKMSTEDNFQLYISGINQVNEIVTPDPVKQLMAEGK